MSVENGRYAVGIEMDELEEQDHSANGEGRTSFKDRFKSILMGYNDEKTWWVAVEDLLKRDADFAEKVRGSSVFLHTQ